MIGRDGSGAPPAEVVRDAVARALAEDFGQRGDVTGALTITREATGSFRIRTRRAGVLAGSRAALEAFAQVDPAVSMTWRARDGERIGAGQTLADIEGRVRPILAAERTALNFLGRLSGIATLTRRYVDAVAGTGTMIAHTRKTTPGLRALELAAVAAGGGAPHRFGLNDAVLIKDNHVAACGGAGEAIRRARAGAGHMLRIAVEIDRFEQLDEAIAAGADSILLDNFAPADLERAVAAARGRGVVLEASGGITLDNVGDIAATGVDVISVGAITHSAPNLDLGLDAAD